jgi:IclR family pca regulon transcriptional regulator
MKTRPGGARNGGGPASSSKSLQKGLQILGLFGAETPRLSLTDIGRLAGLSPATAHRLVEALVRLAFLRREAQTNLLKLGSAAMRLSAGIGRGFDLLQAIKPSLDEAFDKYNVTVDSIVIEDGLVVSLYRREVPDTLVFKLPVEAFNVVHCTAIGKAYLAWLPEDMLNRILAEITLTRRTSHTLTSRSALLADLRRTRRRGYAVNDQEMIPGLISLAAPLIKRDGVVLGGISFDFSTVQYSVEEAEKRYAPALLRLVQDIRPMLPL